MVWLELKLGTADLQWQMNPLSYGCPFKLANCLRVDVSNAKCVCDCVFACQSG